MINSSEVQSILNQWKEDNGIKIVQYVEDHKWLQSDIEKLRNCIQEYKLVVVAITASSIYGECANGMMFHTGRGNLGIPENFE